MANAIISPSVFLVNGIPTVASLGVAEHFEKPHADVLKSVRKIISECPADFGQGNFSLSSYASEQSKNLPMYYLSRDGFTLLAMGFAGKKALAWKIRYIEAFNAMEKALFDKPKRHPTVEQLEAKLAQEKAELARLKKKLPRWFTLEEQLDQHYLEIRRLVRLIFDHERSILNIIRSASTPVLNRPDVRHSVQMNNTTVMDSLWYSIDKSLEAAEYHAKAMCVMAKL